MGGWLLGVWAEVRHSIMAEACGGKAVQLTEAKRGEEGAGDQIHPSRARPPVTCFLPPALPLRVPGTSQSSIQILTPLLD